MEEIMGSRKRTRVVADPTDSYGFSSPEVKRIKEDLLENLEFDEENDQFVLASAELESFMKSFQEEISSAPVVVLDLTTSESNRGGDQPELGFLREASDNELGLPPFTAGGYGGDVVVEEENKVVRVESGDWGGAGLSESDLWRLDSGIPSFDQFDFEEGNEYVVLDGLFDYSDMGFGLSDLSWRPEILPAK